MGKIWVLGDRRMELDEAIKIINYEKISTDNEYVEAASVFFQNVFNVDVKHLDGTYKPMLDILSEASENFKNSSG